MLFRSLQVNVIIFRILNIQNILNDRGKCNIHIDIWTVKLPPGYCYLDVKLLNAPENCRKELIDKNVFNWYIFTVCVCLVLPAKFVSVVFM